MDQRSSSGADRPIGAWGSEASDTTPRGYRPAYHMPLCEREASLERDLSAVSLRGTQKEIHPLGGPILLIREGDGCVFVVHYKEVTKFVIYKWQTRKCPTQSRDRAVWLLTNDVGSWLHYPLLSEKIGRLCYGISKIGELQGILWLQKDVRHPWLRQSFLITRNRGFLRRPRRCDGARLRWNYLHFILHCFLLPLLLLCHGAWHMSLPPRQSTDIRGFSKISNGCCCATYDVPWRKWRWILTGRRQRWKRWSRDATVADSR